MSPNIFAKPKRAYAKKVILAAGALATPIILRNSGLTDVVSQGFQCNPSITVFGQIPDLKANGHFVGCMSDDLEEGISLGDANVPNVIYKMMMLDNGKPTRFFSFSKSVAVAVKVCDRSSGLLMKNERYQKPLSDEEKIKLKKGERLAKEIIVNAGGRNMFTTKTFAANTTALLRFKKDINNRLETTFRNLYVCDGSIIPENVRVPPTLSLVCLGKYLANILSQEI